MIEFTPENKARFERIVARYPVKRSAILPALHLMQAQEGWLSNQALEYLGGLLDLTPAQVHDTASYYAMFRFRPWGQQHIEICTNLSCALNGADGLIDRTCKKLGVQEGEVTQDGRFVVTRVECLGACGGGPSAQVNGDWLEHCTDADIDQLLSGQDARARSTGRRAPARPSCCATSTSPTRPRSRPIGPAAATRTSRSTWRRPPTRSSRS